MGLNIKNEQTHRLVRELAKLTGESQTEAITTAVSERLQRLRDQSGGSDRLRRMREIARDIAARFTDREKSINHGDLLYDEHGLPK